MAQKVFADRRRAIINHLSRMLVEYLQDHAFPDSTQEEMAERLGVAANVLSVPWWQDVPEICEAASLDVGLAIRDSKGNEVTLWPSENFSSPAQVRKSAPKEFPRQAGFKPGGLAKHSQR